MTLFRSTRSTPLSRQPGKRRAPAFTLIEILVVLSIIGLLLALTIPAMTGLTGSTSLSTATRHVSNLLTLARTEAIAQNTVTRFAVVTEWPGDSNAANRKYCLWAWNRALGGFEIISDWESLPTGIVMEPTLPTYLSKAAYANRDITTVKCEYVLDETIQISPGEFKREFRGESVTMRYLEFGPSGAARINEDAKSRVAALVLTEGFLDGGSADSAAVGYTNRGDLGPKNWSQINTDTLTGRVRIYRP